MAASRSDLKESVSRGERLLEDLAKKHLTGTLHQVETGEWSGINKDLRQHGLPVVELAPPHKIHKVSDLVLMEPETSRSLRQTLGTLMRDCDRRQELIQELILTNNQLRDEVKAQSKVTEKYESKNRDLKVMLESSKMKNQELEEGQSRGAGHRNEEEDKLRNTKIIISNKYKQAKQKCEAYEVQIEELHRKLKKMSEEDDKRMSRQSTVIQQLRKKAAKGYIDDTMLDVIDGYERKVHRLKTELENASHDAKREVGVGTKRDTSFDEATPNYKALIKTYEKQLRETRKKCKESENALELLKLDMESRPDLKDLREAQTRIKKLERIIKKNNLSQDGEAIDNKRYSTHINDLEYLPVHHCRTYLKKLCDELNVSDLDELHPRVAKISKEAETYPKLESFARDVVSVVDNPEAPRAPEYRQRPPHSRHAVWCDKSSHHVVPTLEYWANQIKSHKDLAESVNNLCRALMPWKKIKTSKHVTTQELTELIDSIIEDKDEQENVNVSSGKSAKLDEKGEPSKEMLQGIVEHFMKLFDVSRVVGVYTRMNDIYAKLGEVYNLLKTLRDLLGLDTNARSGAIVDCVAKLCKSHNSSTYQQLQRLLQVDQLESVVQKLEEHEELFPLFQEIIEKLMDLLQITRIDQVIPAVKALQLIASSSEPPKLH